MMNHLEKIVPMHAQGFDDVAQTIARDTGAPIELAARIFKEELRELGRHARITQFVNLLASRRARMKLQQFRHRRAEI